MGLDHDSQVYYDAWAAKYEADILKAGYRLPYVAAAVVAHHVSPATRPILDAGCGTGLQVEPLILLGYGPFVGIDISEGMIAIARSKRLYERLYRMALGEPLDFPDDEFPATFAFGCITPGHAPPEAFDELIRVTKPGGVIGFSLRVDQGQLPAYPARVGFHEQAGRWTKTFETNSFQSLPLGEPQVLHKIYLYRVT